MTTGYKVNGTDLASIFGAKGASTAPTTGYKSAGTDLNQLLLAIADGQASGVVTGYKVNGADLNTIFGVPLTSLPINGGTYTTTLTRDGTSGPQSEVAFVINGGSWYLESNGTGGTASPGNSFAGGSLPSGASTVEFTTSNARGGSTVYVAGTTGSALAVSSNPSITTFTSAAGTVGTANGQIDVTIVFKNSSGTVISTTTYTAVMIIQN